MDNNYLEEDELNQLLKKIGKVLERTLDQKGIMVRYEGEYIDLDKDDVEISVKCSEIDNHMVSYVISKMFLEGKIAFKRDVEKDVEYLKKLLKED